MVWGQALLWAHAMTLGGGVEEGPQNVSAETTPQALLQGADRAGPRADPPAGGRAPLRVLAVSQCPGASIQSLSRPSLLPSPHQTYTMGQALSALLPPDPSLVPPKDLAGLIPIASPSCET